MGSPSVAAKQNVTRYTGGEKWGQGEVARRVWRRHNSAKRRRANPGERPTAKTANALRNDGSECPRRGLGHYQASARVRPLRIGSSCRVLQVFIPSILMAVKEIEPEWEQGA